MDNGIHHPLKPSFPPPSIYIAYDIPDISLASPSYSTSTSLASAMSPPTPWYGGLHPQPYKDAVERFEKLDIRGINYGCRKDMLLWFKVTLLSLMSRNSLTAPLTTS